MKAERQKNETNENNETKRQYCFSVCFVIFVCFVFLSGDGLWVFRRYLGIWRLALIILIGSTALILLPLGWSYFRRNGRQWSGSFIEFAFRRLQRWRWLLWLLIVTDVFLLSNYMLVCRQASGLWDVDSAYAPYQIMVADFARSGRLVQWDPWSNGGQPAGSDPQVGAHSPLNILIGLITGGTTTGFTFYWLLVWWLGGVGVLLLARHLKVPSWGGGVAALGFLFCGFYTGHAEHTSAVLAFSALPLVVWRLDAALCSRSLQPAFEAGAIWGFSALSGYPAQTILTGCFAGLWAIGRWLTSSPASDHVTNGIPAAGPTRIPSLRQTIYSLALMALIGGLVLLPSYFGFFYEGAGTHTRVEAVSRQTALTHNALTPGSLVTFVSPYLPILKLVYGIGGIRIWPMLDISMCSIYAGALTITLAVFALFNRPRDRWRWWLLGMALFGLACALGDTLPLRGWLYDWFYPMRFFRHPAIFRAYFLFSILILALIASKDIAVGLKRRDAKMWSRLLLVSIMTAGVALPAIFYFIHSLPVAEISLSRRLVGYSHAFTVWPGMCLLAFVFRRMNKSARRLALPLLVLTLAAGDAFLTSIVSSGTVIDLNGIARWDQLDQKHSTALDLTTQGLRREERSAYPAPYNKVLNNDQMITKIPVLDSYSPAENRYHHAIARDPHAKLMATGGRRIWFARAVAQMDLNQGTLEAYLKHASAIKGYPVIVHSESQMIQQKHDVTDPDEAGKIYRLPAAEPVTVNLLKYSPEELTFDVVCPDEGWLLVTDRWARSWKARINDRQETVYGANFIFRAVRVSRGPNRVSMTYQPLAYPWLTVLSWTVLSGVLFGAFRRYLRRRKN